MSSESKRRRRYQSPLRQAQATETRQRGLGAARHLFLTHGYGMTTVAAIAHEAGLATQTVYATFGSKRAILTALLDLAIGGNEQPLGMLERPGPRRMRDEPEQRRQLTMLAHGIAEILDRAGPIFAVMRGAAAADLEIAALYERLQDERRRNMTTVVEWVAANGPLRDNLTVAEGADIVWTLTSADVHQMLTVERGWTAEQYARWLTDTLAATLLA